MLKNIRRLSDYDCFRKYKCLSVECEYKYADSLTEKCTYYGIDKISNYNDFYVHHKISEDSDYLCISSYNRLLFSSMPFTAFVNDEDNNFSAWLDRVKKKKEK